MSSINKDVSFVKNDSLYHILDPDYPSSGHGT